MTRHVVVVGGGVAGTAAAWIASESCEVTLVDGGVGATSLTSGAIDVEPWDRVERAARLLSTTPAGTPLDDRVTSFARALGLWSVPLEGPLPLVATTAGRVRSARGLDRSLLDLRSVAGRKVLLPRVDRPGWDADSLARAFAEDAPAELGLSFEAVDGYTLKWADERYVGDAELASRHDDPARLSWLAGELRKLESRFGSSIAVLLGPWLGASAPRAAALSSEVGFPVGEALSGPPGPAGMRFESARNTLLADRKIELVRDRVTALQRDRGAPLVDLAESPSLRASTVVLAIGGLVGGGITFDPPDHAGGAEGAASVHAPFRLGLDVELDRPFSRLTGSLVGPVLDTNAWPTRDRESALERVGLDARDGSHPVALDVYAAGDVVSSRPRTILDAIATGIRAGLAASRAKISG